MFGKCPRCEALADEVRALRAQVTNLTDKIVAMADLRAYQATSAQAGFDPRDYFGNVHDEMVEFDGFGQQVVVQKAEN